jgi:hypothetical protein
MPRTFAEWIDYLVGGKNTTVGKIERARLANALIEQKTAIVKGLKAAAIAANELMNVRNEADRRVLQERVEQEKASLELLRLQTERLQIEADRLKVEEEIAQRQALRDDRIKTQQLEETRRQVLLLNEISPPPIPAPPPSPEVKDPVEQAIEDHRTQLSARNAIKQNTISDFLSELVVIYNARMDDDEKASRIRALMETYRQDAEKLPTKVRTFLNEVENRAVEGEVVND